MLISTAKLYLDKFFSTTSGDEVTLTEIYKIYNFALTEEKKNRMWIGNKLTLLKKEGLVEPLYDGKKANSPLRGLRLTDKGKGLLSRTLNSFATVTTPIKSDRKNGITLNDVVRAMPHIRRENPDFEITFDFRLRNG